MALLLPAPSVPCIQALEAAFPGGRHVYERADNGALVTPLRAACDFIAAAVKDGKGGGDGGGGGGGIVAVTEEEGEAGAAFILAAFLVIERGMSAADAADAVIESRPTNALKDHGEFMKNLRFLGRNGIPDWA